MEYNLAQRDVERELIPMARSFDLAVTAWSPLAGGVLTGKYSKAEQTASDPARHSAQNPPDEKKPRITEAAGHIAREVGRPLSQVALNWLRQRSGIVIPIIGARKAGQVQENLGCLEWQLTPEQVAKLDEVSKIELGFPHDFLASDFIRQIIFGGTYSAIDNHRR